MKTSRSIIAFSILMLTSTLLGCRTMVTYDGARLPVNRVATLDIRPVMTQISIADPSILVRAIEVDGRHDPKGESNPRYIELLPGKHSVHLEYVVHHHAGEQSGTTLFLRDTSSVLASGTVTLDAKADHKYVLNVNVSASGVERLRGSIVDETTGQVVYPQREGTGIQTNATPFSASEIPRDKATVCFYRNSKLLSAANTLYISENTQDILSLGNGSLAYYVTTPGPHTYEIAFTAYSTKSTNVDLMPGVVSYLRASTWDEQLTVVPEAEALKETRGLKNSEIRPANGE